MRQATVIIYKIETNRMKLSWFNLSGFVIQFFLGGSNSEFEMGIVENADNLYRITFAMGSKFKAIQAWEVAHPSTFG